MAVGDGWMITLYKQEQELKPETPNPNEEKEWGKPSYLDRLQALDDIIQHTPINERAASVACQEAYAMLKIMHHPKFHICSKCGSNTGTLKRGLRRICRTYMGFARGVWND